MNARERLAAVRWPRIKKPLAKFAALSLIASCAFNFAISPNILCLLDGKCGSMNFTSLLGVYSRTVAITCMASFAATLCRNDRLMAVHDRNVQAHEKYEPTTRAERRRVAVFRAFCAAVCVAIVVPVNALRLWLLHTNGSGPIVLVFFVFMYTQNLSMCFAEVRFVSLCQALSGKFAKVNRDLQRLGEKIVDPVMAVREAAAAEDRRRRGMTYRKDVYGLRPANHSTANALEVLRIRHKLLRDAVCPLSDLFGFPMGMSLFTLCVMTLFDIYYQVFRDMGASTRPLVLLYFWLCQYFVRFYTIVVSAHNTTKQALKSKAFIADINHRYLDDNTKEELQLFLNQISSSSVEFTACDFFTLNTHLITSTITAGITYLVILLQLNSSKE